MSHSVGLRNLVAALDGCPPDKWPRKDWLITLLAKVPGESCEIFQRNYKPPADAQPRRKAARQEVYVDNSDGFWTGLSEVSFCSIFLKNIL